jgi:outer membrane protein with beta-barrel domain
MLIPRQHRSSLRLLLVAAALTIASSSPARAQPPKEPIGPFAADARVAMPRFKEDTGVAQAIVVDSTSLPTRGLGLAGGVHWYPGKMGAVTLGIGGEILLTRGSKSLDPEEEGGTPGPTVTTRFSSLSPQVSLNFGTGRGWSYLTVGLGTAAFTTERKDDPVADADGRVKALNYGGGARWFAKDHLAFMLDLRFYTVDAQAAATGRPAYSKMRMMIISGGISIK